MIPPSLLNVSYLFTLVPIWEQEPVATPSAGASPANADDPATDAAAQPNGQTGADADGVNDQVAMRMVLKGYRLSVMPDWLAEANPGYTHWVENRSDDDNEAERQRQAQLARARLNPHAPSGEPEAGSAPPTSSDSGE